MSFLRYLLTLLLLAHCATAAEQDSVKEEIESTGLYLRVANLLPLGSGVIKVDMNEIPLVQGLVSGMVMHYLELDKGGGELRVISSNKLFNKFEFNEVGDKQDHFYSLVIYTHEGVEKADLVKDYIETKIGNIDVDESVIDPRIRVYIGGYDFSLECFVGNQKWELDGNALIAEEISEMTDGEIKQGVRVQYLDRHGREAMLRGPLHSSLSNQISVFVSQRGKQRLRLEVFPDCVRPPKEDE